MQYIEREKIKEESLSIEKLNDVYQKLLNEFNNSVSQNEDSEIQKIKKEALENFYKQENVRKHLVFCYGLKCSYCESLISSTSYFEVDHFYPKNPTSSLPRQFKNFNDYKYKIVNDVRNFHLSCKRCNLNKKDFTGLALSPNFYHTGKQWKKYKSSFIEKNFSYEGATVKCSKVYLPFIEKMHLNTSTEGEKKGLHLSLLLERTRHLNKIGLLLNLCKNLCLAGDLENARIIYDFLGSYFEKKAQFSRMIVINWGNAYLKIGKFLNSHI